jgi:hypothetical protein
MLLSVFTRHATSCRFSRDRACRRCNCPKWVGGQVNGYYFRQSAKTRQWAEAEEVRVKLEEALIKGQPPFGLAMADGLAPRPIPTPANPPPSASRTEVPEPRVPKPRPRVTVAQAVEAYLADAVSRSVETSTLKKLETIFRKQFLVWTGVEGIEYLDELELDTLLNFRNTWEDGPLAKQKKQSRVIGFFWACVRRRYLTENPAVGLGKIKVVQIPTDYFPPDEFERIIAATYIRRGDRGGGDVKANQTRLRTMTLLMRWSGLRIRDAVTLERHRLNGDSLLLYQAKTGTPVYVPLPPHVVEALESIPPGPKPNPRYFFWSGNGDPDARYLDPTVIYPVTWDDPIMEDEIFGPLLPILTYKDMDAAIREVKKHPKPLSGFLFSRDQKAINHFLASLSFGGGAINQVNIHLFIETMPFGGVGYSGIGHYYGKAGFDALTHAKSVLISPPDVAIEHLFPPYTEEKVKALSQWFEY